MNIKVKYFGILAEKIGISEEEINIEFLEKINLRDFFNQKHPKISNKTYKIAINQEITDVLAISDKNIEVALLPPFAGG